MRNYDSKAYPWGVAMLAGLIVIATVIGAINERQPAIILIGLGVAMLAYRPRGS